MAQTGATINVNVNTNAATSVPKQIQQGYNSAQKFLNNKPLKIEIDTKGLAGLKRQLQLPLGQISKDANEFEKSMKAATARTLAFGATVGSLYAIQKAFSLLVTTSIKVEKTLKEIQVISGASADQFKTYSKGIFEAARATSESFDNASMAALEFARQGLSLEEQLKRTRDALILTKTAGIAADKSVEAITASLNTFNTQLKDSTDLVDRLTAVDNSFAVSTKDLAEGLQRVGNTSQEANVSLDQTLGAITALQQRTARGGAVIGNALKSIFTRIGREDNVELLNSLGIATKTVTGESRNAIDVLKELSGVYKNLDESQRKQISSQLAGLYQINQFQALIADLGSSYSILDQAVSKAGDSQGSAAKRIAELNTTTSALFEQTRTNLTQLASQIGTLTFENPLKNFLQAFTSNDSLLQGFNDFLGKIGTDSENTGTKIAEGILKGIGNVLGGSGVIFLAKLLAPLARSILSFGAQILNNNLLVNQELKGQQQLQLQINNALSMASEADRRRIANAASLNQQLEMTLQLLRAQQAVSISPFTSALYGRGVRAGERVPVIPKGRADGYSPLRSEVAAIKGSKDYAGNRNATPRLLTDFSIKGVKQNVLINSAEKIVPTKALSGGYNGPDKYSILNPRQQKMLGFASGFTPDVDNITTKAQAAAIFRQLEQSGQLPNDFPFDAFRKANTAKARQILRRYVPKATSNSGGELKSSYTAGANRFGFTPSNVDRRPAREGVRKEEIREELFQQDREMLSKRKASSKLLIALENIKVAQAKKEVKDAAKQEADRRKLIKNQYKAKQVSVTQQIEIDKRKLREQRLNDIKDRNDIFNDGIMRVDRLEAERVAREAKLEADRIEQRNARGRDFEGFLNTKKPLLYNRALNKQLGKLSPEDQKFVQEKYADRINAFKEQGSIRSRNAGATGSLALGIGLPLAAGLVEAGANNKGGRITSSALNYGGVGASIGGFFGLPGLLIGTGLGALTGAAVASTKEPDIERSNRLKQKLDQVSKNREQVSTFDNFIQQTAELKDLAGSADPAVIAAKSEQLAKLRASITDKDLLKQIDSIDPTLSSDEQISKLTEISSRQKEKNDKRERRALARNDLDSYFTKVRADNNAATLARGASSATNYGGSLAIPRPLAPDPSYLSRYSSDAAGIALSKDKDQLERFGQFALDFTKLKGGVTSNTFNAGRFGRSKEDVIRGAVTPSTFAEFEKETAGASPVGRVALINAYYDKLKAYTKSLEEGKKIQDKANAEPITKSKVLRELNQLGLQRESNNFGVGQRRENGIFSRGLNLETRSPFITGLTKDLEQNALRFDESKNSIFNRKDSEFSSYLNGITQEVTKTPFLTKVANELKAIQTSNSGTIDGNIDALIKKLGIEGSTTSDEIQKLRDNFKAGEDILNRQLSQLEKQNALTEKAIRAQEQLSRAIGAFGGFSAVGKRGDTFAGLGNGLSDISKYGSFDRTKRGFGSVFGLKAFNKQRDALSISAAQGVASDYDLLIQAGIDPKVAGAAVNTKLARQGNTADIKKTSFDTIKNIATGTGLGQFDPGLLGVIKNAKDPQEILSRLSSGSYSGNNKDIRDNAVNLIKPLLDQFRNAGNISEVQTAEKFKLDLSKDNPLNVAAKGIEDNTTKIDTNLGVLNSTISTLTSVVKGLYETGKGEGDVSVAVNVNGDSSDLATKVAELSAQIQLIFGRLGTVADAANVKFPPAKQTPPSVNNGQLFGRF